MSTKGPMVVFTQGGQQASPGEAHLWVCSGKNIGRRFAIDKPDMVIGRSSSADIPVVDERVSQQHAIIETREGGHHLRDLGSTNGTFVNNQRLHEARLRDGDLLQVGETVFEYLSYEERNLTITLRGTNKDDDAVPAALRDGARQMLQNARHSPEPDQVGSEVPRSEIPSSQVPLSTAPPQGATVDVFAEDPAATGPAQGVPMGAYPNLQRPARDVGPVQHAAMVPQGALPPGPMPPVHTPYMMSQYPGGPPMPYGPYGTMAPPGFEERQGYFVDEEDDEEDEGKGGIDIGKVIMLARQAVNILLPYWKSILACVILGLAGGFALFKANPPQRTAMFEVSLDVKTMNNPLNNYGGQLQEFFQSAELAFRSTSLIERSLIELGEESPSQKRLNAVKKELTFLSAGPPQPNTYTGSYVNTDPDWALRFLETHLRLYLEAEVEKALKTLKAEANFLRGQIEETAKSLRRTETELMTFKKKNLEGLPSMTDQAYQRLFSLRNQEAEAVVNLMKARRTRSMIRGRLSNEQPLIRTKARYNSEYRTALVQVELQLTQERASGKGPDHPEIIKLEKRKRDLEAKAEAAKDDPTSFETSRNPIYTSMQNEERQLGVQEEIAQQQLAHIRRELEKAEKIVGRLPELEAEHSELMRSYTGMQKRHAKLLQQLQTTEVQLNLERASNAARYDIITEPHLEFLDPKMVLITKLLMGGIVGFIIGLLIAALRWARSSGLLAALLAKAQGLGATSDETALAVPEGRGGGDLVHPPDR